MSLRIALFGQAAFGKDCLERLRDAGHQVVGVFAPPDAGRPDPLAARAEELGIATIKRRYYRRRSGAPIPAAVEEHRALAPDLNVLAFVNVFLPAAITDAPPHRSLCFHPSLLPKYRGGNALAWQIILGETQSGVTVFVPDEGADTGPIAVQKGGVRIEPHDTMGSLYFQKLYPLGLDAIVEAVGKVAAGTLAPVPQDESRASHQGLVDDAIAGVSLERPAAEIDRLARGCDPQPGAFLRLKGEPLRLYDTQLEGPLDALPGSIAAVDADGLVLALRAGSLRVGRVRADRGKEPAREFAARVGLGPGDQLESA